MEKSGGKNLVMKRPFDRIVGPDGVRKADDANRNATGEAVAGRGERTLSDVNVREEFVFRCLNAAANLYGVLTREEFVSLYNGYAKGHDAPISDPLTLDELDRLLGFFLDGPDAEPTSIQDVVDEPDAWFATFSTKKGEPLCIAYYDIVEPDLSDPPSSPMEVDRFVRERMEIAGKRMDDLVASFHKLPLLILPEDDFLVYEDPDCAEETKESRAFEKFVKKEYGLRKVEAELDVMGIQSHLRVNGAKVVHALECVRDTCGWFPPDRDSFMRLVNAVSPLVDATRTWKGRGRTQQELFRMGVCPQFEKEVIYDVFGLDDDSVRGEGDRHDEDEWDSDENEGERIYPEDIPLSVYNGPIDFKFVKDAERREAKVKTYEDVRQVTKDFVRTFVMRELTQDERRKAAVRLGFIGEKDDLGSLGPTLDCVVGDFASMMDDQGGEPAIRRVLAKGEGFDEIDRRAASYYANYRYTWLEVLAAKSGVGVKCRDLLTGEGIFLMEKSLSQGEVKGMTVCAGIAPMEDVYISVGAISTAWFENPATILKIVLTHLGLPTETPVRLSATDQARFAAETIRRIHANGNDGFTFYG